MATHKKNISRSTTGSTTGRKKSASSSTSTPKRGKGAHKPGRKKSAHGSAAATEKRSFFSALFS
jgi:hypothetical protein